MIKIESHERKTLLYISLFIAVFFNIFKVLKYLSSNETLLVNVDWSFNIYEALFQAGSNFGYCYILGWINLYMSYSSISKRKYAFLRTLLINLVTFVSLAVLCIYLQFHLFDNVQYFKIFAGGYFVRFFFSTILMVVTVKIISLQREQRQKAIENEQLKSQFYNAKLNNLKAQLNPHFFFNSLTNLSALIREKPSHAQQYINSLSKIFRYTLSNKDEQVVSLRKEMEFLQAHIDLLKIKFEEALRINTKLEHPEQYSIPSMSLQPLLENVTKHNEISLEFPNYIDIFIEDETLIFINGIQPIRYKESSTGIGLYNLNERFKILVKKEIEILKKEEQFAVKLPLLKKLSV